MWLAILKKYIFYGSIPERNHRLQAKGGSDQYVFSNGFNSAKNDYFLYT